MQTSWHAASLPVVRLPSAGLWCLVASGLCQLAIRYKSVRIARNRLTDRLDLHSNASPKRTMTSVPSRATKAQLCEILSTTIEQRNRALHTAAQSQEQATTALIIAIVAFCLGLLF